MKTSYVLLALLLTLAAGYSFAFGQTPASQPVVSAGSHPYRATQPTSQATQPASHNHAPGIDSSAIEAAIRADIAAGRKDQAVAAAKEWLSKVLVDNSSQSPREFVSLYAAGQALGDAGLNSSLASAWSGKCVADADFRGRMLPAQWRQLGDLLKALKQDDTLKNVASLLAKDFNDKKANLRRFDLAAANELRFFAETSDSKELKEFAGQCMGELALDKGGGFRKDLAPFEISLLANQYSQQKDADNLQKLREFIVKDYLPQDGLAGALSVTELKSLFEVLGSQGEQVVQAQTLLTREVRDGNVQLSRLSPTGVRMLAGLMGKVDDGTQSRMTALWVGGHDDLEGCDAGVLAQLTKALFAKDTVADLNTVLADKYDKRQLSRADWQVLTAFATRMAPTADRKAWADKCKSRLLGKDSISTDELSASIAILIASGWRADDANCRGVISKLADFDQTSDAICDDAFKLLAGLFKGKRTFLETETLMADGDVHLAVFKVTAWVEHMDNDDRAYFYATNGYQKIAKGDALARWELARNYLVGVVNGSNDQRKGSTGYLPLAIAAATSDSVRLQCLREAAGSSRAADELDKTLQMVQSMEGQFRNSDKPALDQIKKDIQKQQAVWKATHHQGIAAAQWRDRFNAKAQSAALAAGEDKHRTFGQTGIQTANHRYGS